MLSGSEAAYFSLNDVDKQKLKNNNKINPRVFGNLENQEKLLVTILVANSFIKICLIIFSADLFSRLITFQNLPVLEFVSQVILIFILLLLFTDVLPKIIARNHKISFVRFMAEPLNLIGKLISPVSNLIISSTTIVNERMLKHEKNYSIDKISKALKLTTEQQLSEEKEILEGIVKFGDKNVSEIMKPRIDVVSLELKTTFQDGKRSIRIHRPTSWRLLVQDSASLEPESR